MYNYPAELTPDDNDTFMVTFPDVPEAVTFGDTQVEALERGADALATALSAYVADRRAIPAASAATNGLTVSPPLLSALKLAVYEAMHARGWRKADLARAMAANPRQIDRLLDLRHASTIAQLDQAMALCGRRVVVDTVARAGG